jgi:hypothetical protein
MGRVRTGKGTVGLAMVMLFGLWKLVYGIISVVSPKSEHRSIPDMEE